MTTVVHFIGTEKTTRLAEDYDAVNSQLHADQGNFSLDGGGSRVTIYKSAIAYIEESSESAPMIPHR
jgi:hypothetical protein